MYFVSVDAGAQVAIILLACRPCVVIVNLLGQVCTLGRAPRTKETLPDFHEWCRVTQHPRVFHGLTGCQRTPRFWGVTCYNMWLSSFCCIVWLSSSYCVVWLCFLGSTFCFSLSSCRVYMCKRLRRTKHIR